VLTLALRGAEEAWLKPFARALGEDAAQFGCPLLGGDTVSTPGPLMISITAFGRVPQGRMVHRRRRQAGDRVIVTGTIGECRARLDVLKRGPLAAALGADVAASEIADRALPRAAAEERACKGGCAIMPAPRWMCPMVWLAIWQNFVRRRRCLP